MQLWAIIVDWAKGSKFSLMKLFFAIFVLSATVCFSAQETPLETDLKSVERLLQQIEKQSKDKVFKEQIRIAKKELDTLRDMVHIGLTTNTVQPLLKLQKRLRGYPQQEKLQPAINSLSKIIAGQGAFTVTSHKEFGLQIIEMIVPEGVYYFQIPDDIGEADPYTFSVRTFAAGPSDLERAENEKQLAAYKLLMASIPIQAGHSSKQLQISSAPAVAEILLKTPEDFEVLKSNIAATEQNIETQTQSQPVETTSELEVDTQPPAEPVIDIDIPHLLFQLSSVNQAGRLLEVRGPFDGNASNTDIRVNGNPMAIIAESPRKAIAVNPNLVGQMELRVAEDDKKVHCVYKNVDIRNWASASTLQSGANAALTIQLNSSPKLTSPVVIALQNKSPEIVNVQGGSFQYLIVNPNDLNETGSVTLTRILTGMHPAPFKIDVRLDTTNLFSTCRPPE
jgi:hypothetical protein